MEAHTPAFKFRLGLFIIIGIILFILGIFVIGKQKNLFDPVFKLKADFRNVSGLQVGNTVRFSGINIGTVDNIAIVNDSTVKVEMLIKKEVQKFIKSDSKAGIGAEGIIGDKVIVLSPGDSSTVMVKDGQMIASSEPVETDEIMKSLQMTADNAAVATNEISEILIKINKGEGTLGRLIQDKTMADNIDQTIKNLKQGTNKLDENMEAAKHNFLLKGFFKKKQKAADKAKKEAEKKAAEAKEQKEKAAEKAK
ncbi:MlaD family protein [Flavobacterium sp. GT3R68]|uniref:MlaD family protein n=1 Tax=Flavobacterium sp. GT3R68 TaxID=2594437 RepID=UPI000F898266|nr:MlaD family protein [Flavobacterium sp. GT3R68]RTY95031.1 MCE family protein [Flavobacterium sp. GSN2]TRW91837.1 MCE family protein [Flavobacterium sp. GT3R68]